MIVQWLFVLLFHELLSNATGYSTGAPDSACSDLTPQHGTLPQSSPSPFQLDLSGFQTASSFVYTPGVQYQCKCYQHAANLLFISFAVCSISKTACYTYTVASPALQVEPLGHSNLVSRPTRECFLANLVDFSFLTFVFRYQWRDMKGRNSKTIPMFHMMDTVFT